ncbi:hypothetical protein CTA2_4991, partial [Colletotrichum tanaceti]
LLPRTVSQQSPTAQKFNASNHFLQAALVARQLSCRLSTPSIPFLFPLLPVATAARTIRPRHGGLGRRYPSPLRQAGETPVRPSTYITGGFISRPTPISQATVPCRAASQRTCQESPFEHVLHRARRPDLCLQQAPVNSLPVHTP